MLHLPTSYEVLKCGMFWHKSDAMAIRAGIVIESPNPRPVLVVECRRAQDSSSQHAVRWRRNLVAHGLDSEVPYFLLAFPTGLFLWRANADIDAPPDFTAPAHGVLKRYLGPIADQPGGPLEEGLEIALYAWLSDLAHGVRQPEVLSEADQMLVTSGLLEKMTGGTFRTHGLS
jgi:hypothetical protein